MFYNLRRLAWRLAPALVLLQFASASDLPQLSFTELTDNSEMVVSGRITRTWADWDAEHKYIWTHYELAVSAAHKGAARGTVDIAEPGGQLDGVTMSIAGATGYRVGENVLVFLSRMPNGYLRTAGFGQGRYLVDGNGLLHGAPSLKVADSVSVKSGGAATVAPAGNAEVRTLNGMTVAKAGRLVGARVQARGGIAR